MTTLLTLSAPIVPERIPLVLTGVHRKEPPGSRWRATLKHEETLTDVIHSLPGPILKQQGGKP